MSIVLSIAFMLMALLWVYRGVHLKGGSGPAVAAAMFGFATVTAVLAAASLVAYMGWP